MVQQQFTTMYNEATNTGLLSDLYMHDVIGLPYDLDDNGDVVKRESGYEAFQ